MGLTILEKLPPIIDPMPGGKQAVDTVDFIVNWAKANSLWPLVYGTSCCAIEMMSAGSSHHDWSRFGVEVVRATPRQADLIILAGTIVEKMASRLKILYDQMPAPKYVIAMGACTISGGPFVYDNYSVCKGADGIIPVDVYIPGCPPRPEALLHGIMQLQECIKKESIRTPRVPNALNIKAFEDPWLKAKVEWDQQEAERKEVLTAEIAAFKEANPEYKQYKAPRKVVEKPEALKHTPKPAQGLSCVALFELIQAAFPDIVPFELEVTEGSSRAQALAEKSTDYILDLQVSIAQYISLFNYLKSDGRLNFDHLSFVSAVDYKDHFDVVVHLMSFSHGHHLTVRCSIEDRDNPTVETLSSLYATANWHEREVYDLFGIVFENHPDMRRIFLNELADEFVGHPMRKDWTDTVDGRYVPKPY